MKIIEIAESLGVEFAFPSTSVYIENDSKDLVLSEMNNEKLKMENL